MCLAGEQMSKLVHAHRDLLVGDKKKELSRPTTHGK